jgi:lysine-specific demethylase 8
LSNCFIGNAGNLATLHIDGDQREVLLYQVFGEKEVVLFDLHGKISDYVKEKRVRLGMWGVDLGRDDLDALGDLVDGYKATLKPGEAVFIPKLMWHYLGYDTDAMSVNFRFGRKPVNRFLSVDLFHRDLYVQFFASRVSQSQYKSQLAAALETIKEEYVAPKPTLRKRIEDMRALFKSLCNEYGLQEFVSMSEEDEFSMIEAILEDVASSAKYVDPARCSWLNLVGELSPTQHRQILDVSARHGHSRSLLSRLLKNRLGKSNPEQLTKAEASQFLSYLRSPGASLIA